MLCPTPLTYSGSNGALINDDSRDFSPQEAVLHAFIYVAHEVNSHAGEWE